MELIQRVNDPILPNSYFQFKQFTIYQDQCALKVCTDACLFGAWMANHTSSAQRILDIGSGTGLLMLMLAQQNANRIEGIEIDRSSFEQSQQNLQNSLWAHRFSVHFGDARTYAAQEKYDWIVTNPPFYENDLLPSQEKKKLARHGTELTLEQVLEVITRNLAPSGSFGILLPHHRQDYFVQLAQAKGYRWLEGVQVRQTPGHSLFRSMLCFTKSRDLPPAVSPQTEIILRDSAGNYTAAFRALLSDYYLNL